MMKHGTHYSYDKLKCRCEECRAFKSAYHRQWRERRAARGDFPHGVNGYDNYGCRCEKCCAAKAARTRAARASGQIREARTKNREQIRLDGRKPQVHGEWAFNFYGCRCHVCCEAKGAAEAKRVASERARAGTPSNWGKVWTGPELELVATRSDMNDADLARLLGRTVPSVRTARRRIASEPKLANLAGVDSG